MTLLRMNMRRRLATFDALAAAEVHSAPLSSSCLISFRLVESVSVPQVVVDEGVNGPGAPLFVVDVPFGLPGTFSDPLIVII